MIRREQMYDSPGTNGLFRWNEVFLALMYQQMRRLA